MTTKRADQLKKGDRFASSDGRGVEKVTDNRPYVKGKRSIRTTRCDHHWPNGKTVEVIDDTQ